MSTQRVLLKAANIEWLDDGSPYSAEFNDIYYASQNPIGESEHVYLQANHLQQRWQQGSTDFAIAETGFGTGLNFLLSLRLWRSINNERNGSRQLHYYSAENHPLKLEDLRRALAAFPELEADATALQANYPPLLEGFYTLQFDSQVQLHLLFGSAESVFSQLRDSDRHELAQNAVDAWFLDGFAPGKNPGMWSVPLLSLVAELSNEGTTFSTFSASGKLRRELQSQGFQVRKLTGYGRKRDMLHGQFIGPKRDVRYRRNAVFPAASWYVSAAAKQVKARKNGAEPESITVIGAGLAGCLTAASLARRGLQVSLFDSGDQPAPGASAVPRAALYTRLSPYASFANNFALQSYWLAAQFYNSVFDDTPEGLLELQTRPAEQDRAVTLAQHLNHKQLVQYLSPEEASAVAGLSVQHPALYFPQGRSIDPAALCRRLVNDNRNIEFHARSPIDALERTDTGWLLREAGNAKTLHETERLVVCCGPHSKNFKQLSWLPTRLIRGQTALLQASAESSKLRTVLCANSYLTPATDGAHCAGSSYVLDQECTQFSQQEHRDNIVAAQTLLSPLGTELGNNDTPAGWVGVRCVSPDYLPLLGPAPQLAEFEQQFAKLQHDKNAPVALRPAYWPGLYLNTAMGSRGLCFAPLCAEVIASQIAGQLSPVPAPLRHALLPARIIVRNISRGVFASNKNCA